MPIVRKKLAEGMVQSSLNNRMNTPYEVERYPQNQTSIGLFDTFRATPESTKTYSNDLMIYVFPFGRNSEDTGGAGPDWAKTISEVFDIEKIAWTAWWRFIEMHQMKSQKDTEVSTLPFLASPEDEMIQKLNIILENDEILPGFVRPMLPWPALDEHSVTTVMASRLYNGETGFFSMYSHVLKELQVFDNNLFAANKVSTEEQFTAYCSDPRNLRKLLCNGILVAPTQWRMFCNGYQDLGLGKDLSIQPRIERE